LHKAKKNNTENEIQRKPWISWNTGLVAMIVVSISLALWVGWQVVATEDNIGKGIFWGLIFGGSTWIVFFGMNFFHSLFGRKSKK
jgi:hypothetical protein